MLTQVMVGVLASIAVVVFVVIGFLRWNSYSRTREIPEPVQTMNKLMFACLLMPFTAIPVALLAEAWVSVLWCSLYVALCSTAMRAALIASSGAGKPRYPVELVLHALGLRLNFALLLMTVPLVSTAAFVLYPTAGIPELAGIMVAYAELIVNCILDARAKRLRAIG